jgi:hypothetical protein
MSQKTIWFAVTLLASAFSAPAVLAGNDWLGGGSPYIGGGIGNFSYKTGDQEKLSPKVFDFRIGVPLNPYIALEGRVGTGLSTDFTALLGGYDLQIDSLYGAYLKGSIPLSSYASLYGLAGYSAIKLRRNFRSSPDEKVSDDSASFAGGLDVRLNRNMRLNLEWGRFIRVNRITDGYDADILSVGLVWLL